MSLKNPKKKLYFSENVMYERKLYLVLYINGINIRLIARDKRRI